MNRPPPRLEPYCIDALEQLNGWACAELDSPADLSDLQVAALAVLASASLSAAANLEAQLSSVHEAQEAALHPRFTAVLDTFNSPHLGETLRGLVLSVHRASS